MKTFYIVLIGAILAQQDTILSVDDQVDKFAEDFTGAVN